MRSRYTISLLVGLVSCCVVAAQTAPASNAQAVLYAGQAIAALTRGNSISDVVLNANATYSAGEDETGTATLLAVNIGESRIDISLPSGTRTEIRDAQTGNALGKWINQSGTSGRFAPHNCLTDAVWFFPALSSLNAQASVVLAYVGPETRNGEGVQHLRSYVYQAIKDQAAAVNSRQLSTMDFYLDSTTLLPSAILYNVHPDKDATANIPVEIDFSNYQAINGIVVPMRIQKYMQGTLTIDLTVISAVFNSGVSLSNFSVN